MRKVKCKYCGNEEDYPEDYPDFEIWEECTCFDEEIDEEYG